MEPTQQAPSATATSDAGVHFLDYWRVIRTRKEIILAVALLVVITGVLFTLQQPKMYMAQARMEVRDDSTDIPVFEREGGIIYNPYFLRTQFEILQSRPLLEKVARGLELPKKWGEKYNADKSELPIDDTVKILGSKFNVEQVRDTSLIGIRVSLDDPGLAAAIANKVCEVYKDTRRELKLESVVGGIKALQDEVQKQRQVVDDAEKEIERLRKDADVVQIGSGMRVDKIRLQQLEADRIAARVDMIARKARLDQIENLQGDELLNAVIYIVNDPEIQTLRRSLADADLSLRLMLESYGENYPDVLRGKAGRDELQKKMASALQGVKRGLRIEYESSLARYQALDDELKRVKEMDLAAESNEKYRAFLRAEREVELKRTILNTLEARVQQESIKLQIPATAVQIIERAAVPRFPYSPRLMWNLLISLFVGLAAGVGLAYFIEYLDTSVKTVDDVERYLGLPVIGVIPQKVRPLIEEGPDSSHAEAYRVLRTNLLFANKGASGGAFAVASGGVGEGKSTTLFNLAYVCATIGDKVLIVDSDLRRPIQHTIMGMQNRFGLTNVLMRDVPIEETIKPVPNVPNLHFLPSGKLPRSSVGVLNTQRMRELIKNLKARYDYVFFDSPPVVGVSDASILASEVDGVLLVVQYRKYPRIMSMRAKRMIENVGGKLTGVVLNNINVLRDDYYYYYHSYYSNYYYRPGDASGAATEGTSKRTEPS